MWKPRVSAVPTFRISVPRGCASPRREHRARCPLTEGTRVAGTHPRGTVRGRGRRACSGSCRVPAGGLGPTPTSELLPDADTCAPSCLAPFAHVGFPVSRRRLILPASWAAPAGRGSVTALHGVCAGPCVGLPCVARSSAQACARTGHAAFVTGLDGRGNLCVPKDCACWHACRSAVKAPTRSVIGP